jgi:4-hydroxy-3-methylbut-2-en-1-yl diphosphate reductase
MTVKRLLVFAPLRLEARAVRSWELDATVLRTGMGPRRAMETASRAAGHGASAVVIAGCCGALDDTLSPGDVVVGTEVRGAGKVRACPGAAELAASFERCGLPARSGPIVSVDHIVRGAERSELAAAGAVAVDMESAWLAEAVGDLPLAVVRTVLDTPSREILNPLATAVGSLRAYRALTRCAPALTEWLESAGGDRIPEQMTQ